MEPYYFINVQCDFFCISYLLFYPMVKTVIIIYINTSSNINILSQRFLTLQGCSKNYTDSVEHFFKLWIHYHLPLRCWAATASTASVCNESIDSNYGGGTSIILIMKKIKSGGTDIANSTYMLLQLSPAREFTCCGYWCCHSLDDFKISVPF